MALEVSSFFDSIEGDERIYPADDFAAYFRDVLTDGIKNGGTNLQVGTTLQELTVQVNYGVARLLGYRYALEDDGSGIFNVELPYPDSSNPRIDRIILKLDKSLPNRYVRCIALPGTPAASPQPTALTRNDNIWELSLARVRVNAGSTAILASQITDERLNQQVCGLINSLITLDTATLEAQFNAFMQTLQGQTYVSQADHTSLANRVTNAETTLTNNINQALKTNSEVIFAKVSATTVEGAVFA